MSSLPLGGVAATGGGLRRNDMHTIAVGHAVRRVLYDAIGLRQAGRDLNHRAEITLDWTDFIVT